MKTLLPLCVALGWASTCAASPSFQIEADYPGGNVRLLRQEGDSFTLAPDLRDTQSGQWWFYFNFRLRGPADQPVTIRFLDRNPIGVRGPARSVDGGRTWDWMGPEAVRKSSEDGHPSWSFRAMVPTGASEVRYAFAPAYLEAHLREWLRQHEGNPALRVSELCRSRKGRSVEVIRAGCLDGLQSLGVVLLTSRHHACESMATYALEGLLSEVLSPGATGEAWRKRWEVVALPFADKDGVEEGDQGKNRAPHDHNRDYNAVPLYPEVAAWMKLGQAYGSRVVFSLDLHCPYISGPWNDGAYLVGGASAAAAEKERAFAAVLERLCEGPIPFRASDCYLPFGSGWNQAGNFAAGRSNGAWARDTFTEARFAGTLEVAYASAFGVEVNASSARALGRDLARAILEHLDR